MTDVEDYDIMDVSVSPDDPATGVDVDALRAGLASDDASVRLHAASVASFVPHEESERLEAVVPELTALLSADEQNVTIYQGTIALAVVSENAPEAIAEAVPRLVELLAHDMSLIRSVAATCLANVAMDRPQYVADEIETLVAVAASRPANAVAREHVENDDLTRQQRESLHAIDWEEGVRQQVSRDVAANLLVEVASHDPAAVAPHAADLVAILEDGPQSVTLAVADAVGQVAREDPTAVSGAVDPLRALLEAEDTSVVATAITALGFIGDPAAVSPLREVADDEDRDADLRDLADETADFVEGANGAGQ